MKLKLTKGNAAIAEAAVLAGVRAYFGYPITPQNEVPEYLSRLMPKAGGVFVQAESEVAAINMVYGAAATGVRTMTSSSSPGMALKQEGISYLSGANLPCLIVSVSRAGPGLGGILPSQSDYFQATRGGGNGDYQNPVFAPSTVQEIWDLVFHALNIADEYRTPVILLLDGALAQMMEPIEKRELEIKSVPKPWATDGDTSARQKNIINSLSLNADILEAQNIERFERYEKIIKNEVMFESDLKDGDEFAIIAYGTPARIAANAVNALREKKIGVGLFRPISLWPFPNLDALLPRSVKFLTVAELSMGQMLDDVKINAGGRAVNFVGRVGGNIFEPEEIVEAVLRFSES